MIAQGHLLDRGWTRAMVRDFLGIPEESEMSGFISFMENFLALGFAPMARIGVSASATTQCSGDAYFAT